MRAGRERVVDGRLLAEQVRQHHDAVGPGRRRRRLGVEHVEAPRPPASSRWNQRTPEPPLAMQPFGSQRPGEGWASR